MRLSLIISSVTILTFFQMVSLLAFRSYPHLIGPDARYEKHKLYCLASTCKSVKKKVTKEGEDLVEFFLWVNRLTGIDVHDFYSPHAPKILELIEATIANILGSKCVSMTPKITFSTVYCHRELKV
jgi:hypothetical protein